MTQPVATLGSVLDSLGLGVLDLVVAPSGVDVELTGLVIYDPDDDLLLHAGELLLAVGLDPGYRDLAPLVGRVGHAGAAGLVVKQRTGVHPQVLDAARDAGVALVAAPAEIAWGQLHSLFRAAMSAAGAGQGPEGGDVPMGDLFALANAVAVMVGGPTTIEDRQSVVLAYSSGDDEIDEGRRQTILGRRVPAEWIVRLEELGVFRQLWSTDEIVRVGFPDEDPPLRERLAIAVRAGDEVLGSIWVAEGRHPFPAGAADALREAARLASLHLLRHRLGEDLVRQRRGEQLRQALDGRVAPEVVAAALALPVDEPVGVIAFEMRTTDPAAQVAQSERLVGLVSVYCEAYRWRAAAVAIGPVVYLVVAATRAHAGAAALVSLADDIIAQTRDALAVELWAGVGSLVPGLAQLVESRWEADQVLRVLGDGDSDGKGDGDRGRSAAGRERRLAVYADDVRARLVMLQLRDLAREQPALASGRLAVLVDHDRRHNTTYIETLRAHLDSFGDVRAAAATLAVHPNTLRYRVRRLQELSGLDLGDPVERLVAQLQLHLAD